MSWSLSYVTSERVSEFVHHPHSFSAESRSARRAGRGSSSRTEFRTGLVHHYVVGNSYTCYEASWQVSGENAGLPGFDKGIDSPYLVFMVKDAEYFDRQKRTWLSQRQLSLEEKFGILDALYDEARLFGHFERADLLIGLDDDVHLAAMLNANVSNPSR